MDFGISGRKALICASSRGLGYGCAEALAKCGARLVLNARDEEKLRIAGDSLRRKTGAQIECIAADITTVEGRNAVLEKAGSVDILVNNAGGPPKGHFKDWKRDDWIRAIDQNMLTSIEMIKAVIDSMVMNKFGRIVNITSGSVKSPIPELGLSNGARSGLTGFVAGIAREYAQYNVTINNLLPGQFNTARIENLIESRAKEEGIAPQKLRASLEQENPSRRLGEIVEFGFACAWICSAQSGYLVGQNILLDGGVFNSTH
ncbi:MAG: SDR family oxidoreductase [Alphaproteobacteria bacterium]|nr:SDR family oxidoreductase [Alphaproteobacteria bacterium]